jgi:prolipoprotein diacylglyceryltransferase
MIDALALATILIYFILLQPELYVWCKHGKHGFIGWFYLQSFCAVRVVGNILQEVEENNHSSSSAALIVSSMGLSPLIIAAAGILHEA